MKYLFPITAILVLGGVYLSHDTALVRKAVSNSGEAIRSSLYDRQVQITGNQAVGTEEIRRLLPRDKSNIWWSIHTDDVASRVRKHIRIKSAVVTGCGATGWGCYTISVAERTPELLLFVGQQLWTVDSEGAFIYPVELDEQGSATRRQELKGLPVVSGLAQAVSSPDIMKGRTRHVMQAIAAIESEAHLDVREVRIHGNGEMAVRFVAHDFEAVFGAHNQELTRITEEARRLRLVLARHRGAEDALARVDLVFDGSAVVQTKQELAEAG